MNQSLLQFKEYLHKMEQYNQVLSLLHWDLQTTCPKKGVESKLEAISYFSGEAFHLSTSPEYGQLLSELSKPEIYETLDPAMQVTVSRYQDAYERFCRIPPKFYTDYVTAKALSENVWAEAKEKNDFSLFAPHLEKMIAMTKQCMAYEKPGEDPFEVLLDDHEKGMDSASIDKIFHELKEGLVPLLQKITSAPRPDLSAFAKEFPIESQKKVEKFLLEYIGFDFERGTTGETAHPFTMGLSHDDIRVTNHFSAQDPISSMFSAIHEGGHAIYDQNVDAAYRGTALAELNYMGLHESQSRFFENILAKRKSFWVPIYPKIQELLPELKDISLDTFYHAVNDVHASMIRTEADEVTYCLHIILRYEMERAIFYDHIPVADLPALWNNKMKELLGITPANDSEGILQDTHWSGAMFGYFPSYLLGSIYDGLFLQQLQKDLGNVDELLEHGEIQKITHWLNENIHKHGSLYTSKELIQKLCGCEISAKPLLDYFTEKYTALYHL